jgi:hypothetical protein
MLKLLILFKTQTVLQFTAQRLCVLPEGMHLPHNACVGDMCFAMRQISNCQSDIRVILHCESYLREAVFMALDREGKRSEVKSYGD